MDGIDLARAIRRDPSFNGLGLVLLTSSSRPGDTQVAEDAGINAFLTKPARIAHLYDCLATLLDRQEGSAEPVLTQSIRYSFTEVEPDDAITAPRCR